MEKEAKRSEARFTVIHHPTAQLSDNIDKAYKDTKLLLEHKEEKLAQGVSGRPEISESAD